MKLWSVQSWGHIATAIVPEGWKDPDVVRFNQRTRNADMSKIGIIRAPFRSLTAELRPCAEVTSIDVSGRYSSYLIHSGHYTHLNGCNWLLPGDSLCYSSKSSPSEKTYISHLFGELIVVSSMRNDKDFSYQRWSYSLSERIVRYYSGPWGYKSYAGAYAAALDDSRPVYQTMLSSYYNGTYRLVTLTRDMCLDACTSASSGLWSDLGELAIDVLNGYKLTEVNIPAYLVDLPETGKSTLDVIMSVADATKSRNFRELAFNAGKANLSYQYGDRLAIADTKQLITDICNLSRRLDNDYHQSSRASSKTVTETGDASTTCLHTLQATAQCNDSRLQAMRAISSVFNLTNAWDLVPFSFVADWFVNVDRILGSVDAATLDCYLVYDQIVEGRTTILTQRTGSADLPAVGTVSLSERTRLSTMPRPSTNLQASKPRLNQWVNGASLITQSKWFKH